MAQMVCLGEGSPVRSKENTMARDPVCGTECDPRTSDRVDYQGETFYFCSPGCKEEFERNPERYVHHPGVHHGVHGEHRGRHHGEHH